MQKTFVLDNQMINFIQKKLYNLEVRKTDLLLPLFGMIFIAANIGTNIFALRMISFSFNDLSFIVGGGIFIFPITFFTLDTITEYYGFNKAMLIVIFNLIALLMVSFCIFYTLHIATNNSFINDEHYQAVLSPFLRSFFATSGSCIVGYFINCLILDRLKVYFNGRWMIFRLIFATTIAEIIYSVVWNFIYMSGHVTMDIMTQVIGSNFIVKLFFQIISTPFTFIIVSILKKFDNNDSLMVENPFIKMNLDTKEK